MSAADIDRRCPVCGGGDWTHSFTFSRGPVWRCAECGVFKAYDESVSSAHDARFHESLDDDLYVGYFEPFRKGQYRKVLQGLGLPAGATLLDVGASFGWMVQVAADLGLDAHGIEPSPMEYDDFLAARIDEATLEERAATGAGAYDVVTLWHVLEHLRDPFTSIDQVRDLLAPGGKAVIAVPSTTGTMYRVGVQAARRARNNRLMEELWYTHNDNMHRYYFSEPSLRMTLERSGLKVESAFTLDAFDWRTIWTRSTSRVGKPVLKAAGPVLHRSGVTRNENLIAIATRPPA